MKAKDLIERLQTLPPDMEVFVENSMGYPAYDYEGQRFVTEFNTSNQTIEIVREAIKQ